MRQCHLGLERLDHPERTGPASRVDHAADDVVAKDHGDEDAPEEQDDEAAVRDLRIEV